MIITEAIVISILIMFMIMWLVLFYTIHDKIDLLENNLTEIAKSQSGIRESMDKTEMDLCEWFFNLVGYFNHYAFFVNKEWKKIGGFEKYDEAEIKCAFMHYWFHHKFHYFTMPVGMAWFAEVKESSYNDYIEKYKPVINAFEQWLWGQR